MRLLISDITPIDVGLDRAIPWPDDPVDPIVLPPNDAGASDGDAPVIIGRERAWYEPRLTALRRLIAEQQSWETR